jgi:predicted nucleotidyltransferase
VVGRRRAAMAVETKAQVFALLHENKSKLRGLGVRCCAVFGSFVRDEPAERSDVGMLVEVEPGKKTFRNFMDLAFFLEDLFGRKVDIVTPEWLSPHFGPHILREAEYVTADA